VNFELPQHLREVRRRVRTFVDEKIIPAEQKIATETARVTLHALQAEAKTAGLWTPHLPKTLGGQGLGPLGMCTLFREMGRSPFGPKVFHCDAPDQGNMDLLLATANEAQKTRWLEPLVKGKITSAFCMTEPAPGAGADPSNLMTKAREVDGGWELTGHKWFSTGARNASLLIVMARTSDDPRTGATMFLVDREAKGVKYVRDVPTMAGELVDHSEGELEFDAVRVGPEAVLSAVGSGFQLAQARLVPARLTHCMRWLGLATRTVELCKAYITSRTSFGKLLAQHQLIQHMLAEAAAGIHAGNLMTFHCAWMLERGLAKEARPYSSMAKNHVARLLCKTLDDAIQMHGALGYSDDMPFGTWYRSARAARIADGPDEVHEVLIARELLTRDLPLLV